MTSFWLFIFENDVHVPSKTNKQKTVKKISFLVASWEGQWRKYQVPDPDPDPLVRGMDPRIQIRIHLKMVMDPQHCYKQKFMNVVGKKIQNQ